MDQIKIGRFIAACRKKEGLTQRQLAEKLNITDRAVSKWETGKAMPDAAIMLDLCRILNITINDLFSGEVISMDNYNKELERHLLEMARQKQEADKRLLTLEIFIGIVVSLVFFTLTGIAAFVQLPDWLRIVLIVIGFIPLVAGTAYALRIEQIAGYYQCAKCGHRYVPTYAAVFRAMHINRTRFMRCPQCKKRSWQKKVLSKEDTAAKG